MTDTITTHSDRLTEQQAAFIDGLEALAAFLVKHPNLIPDYGVDAMGWVYPDTEPTYGRKMAPADKWHDEAYETTDYANVLNEDVTAAEVRFKLSQLARSMKPCEKDYTGSTFIIKRTFGPHSLRWEASRGAVCERVVVGKETVTVADPEAPRIEKEVEIVEWRCNDSILGG